MAGNQWRLNLTLQLLSAVSIKVNDEAYLCICILIDSRLLGC